MKLPLPFTCLRDSEPFTPPAKQYLDDAGYDLTASRSIVLEPGAFAQVPTNIAVALPPGTWGMLVGRSSTFHRRGIIVNTGIIDSGYRGELMAMVYNPGKKKIVIQEGERLFQLIPIPMVRAQVEGVTTLPASERGDRGFGSTGGFKPQSIRTQNKKQA